MVPAGDEDNYFMGDKKDGEEGNRQMVFQWKIRGKAAVLCHRFSCVGDLFLSKVLE